MTRSSANITFSTEAGVLCLYQLAVGLLGLRREVWQKDTHGRRYHRCRNYALGKACHVGQNDPRHDRYHVGQKDLHASVAMWLTLGHIVPVTTWLKSSHTVPVTTWLKLGYAVSLTTWLKLGRIVSGTAWLKLGCRDYGAPHITDGTRR